jgi:hypothetical protein
LHQRDTLAHSILSNCQISFYITNITLITKNSLCFCLSSLDFLVGDRNGIHNVFPQHEPVLFD